MGYIIPLSNKTGITFEYKGVSTFGKVRWNYFMQCWVTDFNYEDKVIVQSLVLRGGINCLRQFNIPYSIYILNRANPKLDPGNFGSLTAVVLEESDIQSLVNNQQPTAGGIG